MKKHKLPWSLRWENFICSPRWNFENWFVKQVDYALEQRLNVNVFFLDKDSNILETTNTTCANYQVGMIVYFDNTSAERFKIERIEVSIKCHTFYVYGEII